MPSLAKLKALKSSSTDDEVYEAYGINKHQRRFNPPSKLRSRKCINHAIRKTTPKRIGQFMLIKLYIQLDSHSFSDRQCRALLRSARVRAGLNKLGQHSDSPLTFRFTNKTIQRIEKYESGYLLKCLCKVVPNKVSMSNVTHLESDLIANNFGNVSSEIVLGGKKIGVLIGSARLV